MNNNNENQVYAAVNYAPQKNRFKSRQVFAPVSVISNIDFSLKCLWLWLYTLAC